MPVALRTKKFIPKPANPQADPRFTKVKSKIGNKAAHIKKHPPAKLKAIEAANAAKGPPNEKASGAKANQVDSMKDAKAEAPPADSFLAVLREEIAKVMPSNNEDAEKFMEGGAEGEMKNAVGGNVKEQKETASGDLDKTSKAPPNEGGVPTKQVTAIPPDPSVPAPAVNAGEAMPDKMPDEAISQKQTKADAETQLKENRLTPKRLSNKDSRFETVVAEKSNVDKIADASPGKFRTQEKQVLGKATSQAGVQGKTGMTAVVSVKNKSKTAVQSRQDAQKKKDEERRKVVTDYIEGIYNKAKQKVDNNLNSLEADVMAIFDPGSSSAIAAFKSNTKRDIDDYFDDRYSGIGGKLDWIADKFKDTPPRVKAIIKENLVLFNQAMDNLAVRVAGFVDRRLKQAKTDIDAGQKEIKVYVAGLPKDLKAVGQEAEKAMDSRFNEMREGVEAKKNDLAQKLAQKYKEATDKANELAKKIEEENAGAFHKLAKAIGEIIRIILEFKDKLMALLRKAADAIELILDDPIGFLGNLISAIKLGVSQFVDNIWEHLKKGFMEWLFGSLSSAGIEIPSDLSLVSIFKLVMGVLGLTIPRMKAKAVKLLGPTAVAVIEKVIEYVSALITGGPAKLWEQVKSDIGDLKVMVIDAIQDWLITTIVKQATIKLLSFFNPAGAFVQAVLAIYNLVVFLIERASQIMAFVESVINSVSDIAKGNISSAANWIETSLARMIPLVISFLARLIGLGGISQKIKEFINKVQSKVDKAIDKAIGKVVAFVKKMFGKLKGTGKQDERTAEQKQKDVNKGIEEGTKLLEDKNSTAADVNKKLPPIKKKYRLSILTTIVDSSTETEEVSHIDAAASPGKAGKKVKKLIDDSKYLPEAKAKPPEKGLVIKMFPSKSGNNRVFAFKSGVKKWVYNGRNKVWQPIVDEVKVREAEEALRKELKKEMPGFVTFVEKNKSGFAPGLDVAGIGDVAPEKKQKLVTGEEGKKRLVIGEVKGAFGKTSKHFEVEKFTAVTTVLPKRLAEARELARSQKIVQSFNGAVQAGNITIIIYLVGKAKVSEAVRSKLKRKIRKHLKDYIQANYNGVDIDKVMKNVEVIFKP